MDRQIPREQRYLHAATQKGVAIPHPRMCPEKPGLCRNEARRKANARLPPQSRMKTWVYPLIETEGVNQ